MIHKRRSYRRLMRHKNIVRKEKIIEATQPWYCLNERARGRLNKGKVHCSCSLCQQKSTKLWGVTTNSLLGYSKRDKTRFDSMVNAVEEYNNCLI